MSKLYVCSDKTLRNCIMPEYLENHGYISIKELIGLKENPRISIKRIVNCYSQLSILDPFRLECNSNSRSSVDLDIAALSKDSKTLVIGELKSRIIPMIFHRYKTRSEALNVAKLMLQYHLDEPRNAMNAFERLRILGLANKYLDKVSSVCELLREILAVKCHPKLKHLYTKCDKIIIFAAILGRISELIGFVSECIDRLLSFINDLDSDLSSKIDGYVILALRPRSFTSKEVIINVEVNNTEAHFNSKIIRINNENIQNCSECTYRDICASFI